MGSERLLDDVAVVTGAASGIGRAIATRFAEEKATVIIVDIDSENGEAVATDLAEAGRSVEFIETDVSDSDDVERLFNIIERNYDSIDVLVNNAGGAFSDDKVHKVTEATWNENINTNLKGAFLCTKNTIPAMVASGGGRIVNMSSVNGLIGLGHTAYSAAKGGLIPFTKLVASQYGRHGIRVNAICPGEIATEAHEYSSTDGEIRDEWIDQFPMGRFGEPEEVASVALFLASDASSYVNGTHLTVDGGMIAGRNQRLQEVTYNIDQSPQNDR